MASPITMASAGRAERSIFQTRACSFSRSVMLAALRARISRTRISPCERCAVGCAGAARADDRAQHRGAGVGLDGHRRGIHRGQFHGIDVDPNDVARNIELRQEVIALPDLASPPAAPRRRRPEPAGSLPAGSSSPGTAEWDSGRIPLPALVERTGAPRRSAMSVSALRVPTAPPPTRIRGRLRLREAIARPPRSPPDRAWARTERGGSSSRPRRAPGRMSRGSDR